MSLSDKIVKDLQRVECGECGKHYPYIRDFNVRGCKEEDIQHSVRALKEFIVQEIKGYDIIKVDLIRRIDKIFGDDLI